RISSIRSLLACRPRMSAKYLRSGRARDISYVDVVTAALSQVYYYLCKRGAAERLIVPHGQTSSLISLPPFAEHGCGRAAHRLDRWISNAGSENSSGRIFWKCRCRLEWLRGHYPGNEIFV